MNSDIEKLNRLIRSTDRSESAYDPNIPFSLFDRCSISGYEFNHNGEVQLVEHKRIDRRLSDNFKTIYQFLQKLGYKVKNDYSRHERTIHMNRDYKFVNGSFPSLVINFNPFYHYLFKIGVSHEIESGFYDMKDYQSAIIDSLTYWAKRNNNLALARQIKIVSIID